MAILMNPKVWISLTIALALGLAGAFIYRAGKSVKGAEFDAYKLAQQEARMLADRAQRTEEQRRSAAVTKEATDAQTRITSLEDDLRRAAGAADSLRAAADGAARRARASACAAAPSPGQPGADAIGVLVDVLGRADQRAGVLAEHADRLRIAGIACERSYDALTK